MQFSYEALDQDNSLVKGTLEAANKPEAARLLEEKKLVVVALEEVLESRALIQRKLSKQEICISLFELTTLLESEVAIAEAIDSLKDSDIHPELGRFYLSLSRDLQSGSSLGEAIRKADLSLPAYFLQLVDAGEASGQLSEAMKKGVEQLEYDLSVANELRNALIYPSILVLSGIGAVALIFIFVVPKFANLLNRAGDLPLLASMVLSSGMWMNQNIYVVLLLVTTLGFVFALYFSKEKNRQSLLDWSARLPVLGRWLAESDIARWSSVLGAMLSSRVELVKALDLARESVRNTKRKSALNNALRAVQSGENLSKALSDNRILSMTAYNLVRAGEKSGRLAEMLLAVANIYNNNSRDRMKKFLLLIEPMAIIVIGIMIAVIILGLIQAITSVNDIAI